MLTKQIITSNVPCSLDSYRPTLKRKALTAFLVGVFVLVFGVYERQAHADAPTVNMSVRLVLWLGSAALSAGGVEVANIIADSEITASSDDGGEESGETNGGEASGDSGDSGDNGGEDTGDGESSNFTADEEDIPDIFRSYIDRNATLSAGWKRPSGKAVRRVFANTTYNMHGDVRKSKPGTKMFKLTDKLTLRFELTNIKDAKKVPLLLNVERLDLSTVDVPETNGHSSIRFTAMQDGKRLWRWSSRVDQGEIPEIKGPDWLDPSAFTRKNDMLQIRDLQIPIPYKALGKKGTSVVEIIIDIEGQGEHT